MTKILVTMAVLAFSVVAKADHWIGPLEVKTAAHQLDERADAFHELTHEMTGFSRIAAAAHRLAESARHLHQMVDRGSDFDHCIQDFRKLRADFMVMRDEFRRSFAVNTDWRARYSWYRLEFGYQKLEYTMLDGAVPGEEDPHRH